MSLKNSRQLKSAPEFPGSTDVLSMFCSNCSTFCKVGLEWIIQRCWFAGRKIWEDDFKVCWFHPHFPEFHRIDTGSWLKRWNISAWPFGLWKLTFDPLTPRKATLEWQWMAMDWKLNEKKAPRTSKNWKRNSQKNHNRFHGFTRFTFQPSQAFRFGLWGVRVSGPAMGRAVQVTSLVLEPKGLCSGYANATFCRDDMRRSTKITCCEQRTRSLRRCPST